MAEKIGLDAVFNDKDFQRGLNSYTKGLKDATSATEQAATRITASWDPSTLSPRIDSLRERTAALKQSHAELAAEVEKDASSISTAWQGLATAVGGFISVYMVKRLGEAIYQLGELGATVARQEVAFQELAKQAGGSSDAILASIKRATDGTVANSDIILAANKGIMLGLGAQADQWEKLAEVARFRARAMGLSVTDALERITTGIGRVSSKILDDLGIILDTQQVYSDYASAIGKSADALTNAEEKQALLNAVIEEGQSQIAAAGGIARDTADDFEEFAAQLQNAKDAIATWVAPEVAPIIGAIADAIPGAVMRLQLLTAAIQGVITMDELWATAAESQRIQMEQGDEAAQAYVEEVIKVGEVVQIASGVHGDWNLVLNDTETALNDTATAAGTAAAAYLALSDATKDWIAARTEGDIAGMDPYETIEGQEAAAAAIKKQQDEIAKNEEKAQNERKRAQEQALREMQQNEQQYANALGQLYDQIVSAQQQANQARIQEDRDYAREAAKLEQDLANERQKILRDLGREIAKDRREQRQDEEDAERDLNRKLEDLANDLTAKNKATWDDYYAELESLAEQHGQRMQAIEEKYADLRAGIDEKYRTEKTQEELRDEEVEALKKQLAEMRALQEAGLTGIDYTQAINDILAQLDALKQEELAALEAKQAEEAAAEEAAYQAEQEKAAQRREEQLAANQAWYDEEAAQRQLAYERQLEDLRIAHEREREARKIAARQTLDDLKERGNQERAELEAQHNARIAEIERGLRADTAAFQAAYNNQLRDLQTYLNQRMQQWQDHQRAIEALLEMGSPSRWMERIGKSMRQGLDIGFQGPSLATDLQSAVASFGRSMNNLSLPMSTGGGGSNTTNTTHNHNLSVTANYTKPQSERSLRDDLRLNQAMMRMRGSW